MTTLSSINLSIPPHLLPSTTNTCSSSSATSCSPPRSSSFVLHSPLSFGHRRLPISKKSKLRFCGVITKEAVSGSNDMTITQVREDDESEIDAPLLDPESLSKPRRIALFVEPSPFAYVSGYKNRFQNFIRYLREMGDEVIVVTTHEGVPEEFYGARVIGSRSFPCPYYQKVPLSLALSPRIISEIARFKPDIIHASSPGVMVFGALAIAKMLSVPIVMSYHTHVPVYIPRYTFSWLVKPMWSIIRFLHRAADLTLVPSAAIGKDLIAAGATAANQLRLWNKGVDSESFNPRFRSQEMRIRLSNGEPEKPLVIHVGRIGVEKSLELLKSVMDKLPEARIAFIGDGPYKEDLEKLFTGMPAVFTGTLQGDELSQAYASGDVFVMPSESETLGLVVLEAMSSGLPVVAARAGGIPDIIPEDQVSELSELQLTAKPY
ncbi:sulfoquinovosyldiacylglycerol 2 [Arabidopsis thaliana]|uniref:Sulfoquinovosyldiacylglycerol 2 n=1 Tax=Arabidopsis thaliana TaxID=3702 RepID=A0A1P8BCW3_ARATH|nr:sulfoquinovosyldiacylglycerol 2 [Arabidopsis thaliana]ANM69427.1 sulfoquinovosyldiacylglycerol 2 [Arabidopsis thaliana]|eukprot:NP_001331107.1 sulfoquinovosyldiacylglycerol 2 [Arabidopsis thaliana]